MHLKVTVDTPTLRRVLPDVDHRYAADAGYDCVVKLVARLEETGATVVPVLKAPVGWVSHGVVHAATQADLDAVRPVVDATVDLVRRLWRHP